MGGKLSRSISKVRSNKEKSIFPTHKAAHDESLICENENEKNHVDLNMLDLESLLNGFLMVRNLTLTDIRDFSKVAPFLWKFCTSLKSLELWLRLDSPGLIFPGLDAALTGLPPSTVSMMDLLEDPDYDEEVRDRMIRSSSSILNLKLLEKFTLVFYKGEWRSFPKEFRLLSNSVSGKLIFEPMQTQLDVSARVKIQNKMKKQLVEAALEPFSS